MITTIEIEKKYQPYFDALQKAVSDDSRLQLNRVYWDFDEKNLVATDGKKLLVWRPVQKLLEWFPMESCFMTYKSGIAVFMDEPKLSYVQYKRVIPDKSKMLTKPFTPSKTSKKCQGAMACCYVTFFTDKLFNPENFECINGLALGFSIMYYDKAIPAVLLESADGNMKFIAMPMNTTKED